MAKLRWTDEAVKWLQEIHEYISKDNVNIANRVIEGIYGELPLTKESKASQLVDSNESKQRAFEFNPDTSGGQRTVPAPNTSLGDSHTSKYDLSLRDSQKFRSGNYRSNASPTSSILLEDYSGDKLKNPNSSSSKRAKFSLGRFDKCLQKCE